MPANSHVQLCQIIKGLQCQPHMPWHESIPWEINSTAPLRHYITIQSLGLTVAKDKLWTIKQMYSQITLWKTKTSKKMPLFKHLLKFTGGSNDVLRENSGLLGKLGFSHFPLTARASSPCGGGGSNEHPPLPSPAHLSDSFSIAGTRGG